MSERFPCPCCGFLTLSSAPPGTYALCPVCDWEDDGVQFEDPDYPGGANKECLNAARANFRAFRASSREAVPFVRTPLPEEHPRKGA
jgi:hypothetical protein